MHCVAQCASFHRLVPDDLFCANWQVIYGFLIVNIFPAMEHTTYE
jgi:hypothetical protein